MSNPVISSHKINEASVEVDHFVDVLTLNYNFLFGDAIYKVNQNRQIKLRKPEQLPRHDDVQRMKQYTVNRTAELLNDDYLHWISSEFIGHVTYVHSGGESSKIFWDQNAAWAGRGEGAGQSRVAPTENCRKCFVKIMLLIRFE